MIAAILTVNILTYINDNDNQHREQYIKLLYLYIN